MPLSSPVFRPSRRSAPPSRSARTRRWGGPVALALAALLGAGAPAASADTLYITQGALNQVLPVSYPGGQLGTPIPVGTTPWGIETTPDHKTAFVANFGGDTVTPIDLTTNTAGAPIPVGSMPIEVAFTPDGKTAFVSNFGANTVTPIDVATRTPKAAIPVGEQPRGLEVSPDGTLVYVADTASGTGESAVTPIDVATKTAGTPIALPASSGAEQVAFAPDGETAYVSLGSAVPRQIARIDVATGTVGTPILTDDFGGKIVIDRAGTKLYNAPGYDGFGVFDLPSGSLAAHPTGFVGSPGAQLGGLALSTDESAAYFVEWSSGFDGLYVLDTATNTVAPRITVGGTPYDVAVAPDPPKLTAGTSPSFPAQATGTVGPGRPVTVTNDGTVDATVSRVLVRSADDDAAGDFLVSGQEHCDDAPLAPGEHCTVQVRFAPSRGSTTSDAELVFRADVPGGEVAVPLTGTSTTLPKGDPGDRGETGPQGDAGLKGDAGVKGDAGAKGDTGDAGAEGPKGDTGAAGAPGPIGAAGPAGVNGDKGDKGPAGRDGTFAFAAKRSVTTVRRGRSVSLPFTVRNGTTARVGRFTATALAPRALRTSGRLAQSVAPLDAGRSRTIQVRFRVGRTAKLGSHAVRVRLKVAGQTVTRTVKVRVVV